MELQPLERVEIASMQQHAVKDKGNEAANLRKAVGVTWRIGSWWWREGAREGRERAANVEEWGSETAGE